MTAFDPIDWLARFEAANGWYVITDARIWYGWRVDGQEHAARQIWREIQDDPGRRDDVSALVRSQRPVEIAAAE